MLEKLQCWWHFTIGWWSGARQRYERKQFTGGASAPASPPTISRLGGLQLFDLDWNIKCQWDIWKPPGRLIEGVWGGGCTRSEQKYVYVFLLPLMTVAGPSFQRLPRRSSKGFLILFFKSFLLLIFALQNIQKDLAAWKYSYGPLQFFAYNSEDFQKWPPNQQVQTTFSNGWTWTQTV